MKHASLRTTLHNYKMMNVYNTWEPTKQWAYTTQGTYKPFKSYVHIGADVSTRWAGHIAGSKRKRLYSKQGRVQTSQKHLWQIVLETGQLVAKPTPDQLRKVVHIVHEKQYKYTDETLLVPSGYDA